MRHTALRNECYVRLQQSITTYPSTTTHSLLSRDLVPALWLGSLTGRLQQDPFGEARSLACNREQGRRPGWLRAPSAHLSRSTQTLSPVCGSGDDLGSMTVDVRTDSEVYAEHAAELSRFATSLVGPSDAADVVSEAVIRVMISPVWSRAENRRALLYRAVLFEARNYQRSVSRRRRREASHGAITAAEPPEVRPEVWEAVSSLSPQQRAVTFLAYWEDLSAAAIGELLEVSEGTVRKQLARARRRLREVLHD